MSEKKQKLELAWIGNENRPRLEPRVLVKDAAMAHLARTREGVVASYQIGDYMV